MKQPSEKPELLQRLAMEQLGEKGFISLYNTGKIRKVDSGEFLSRRGDQDRTIFLVVTGSFALTKEDNKRLEEAVIFRDGEWIGELAFLENQPRIASIAAIEPSTVLALDDMAFKTLEADIQSFILKKLHDQCLSRVYGLDKEQDQSSLIARHLSAYVQNLLHERSKDYENSEIILNILKNVPRLPIYVSRLIHLLLYENASIKEVAQLAKEDPSLVSQILKIVNSPQYGLRSKIADLNHAILYLGFNQVYQIVVSSGLQKTMPSTREFEDLHHHSVIISHLAYEICQHYDKQKSSTMSTIGLLHDIGESVILLLKKQNPKWTLFIDMIDQAKIGAMLLQDWNIPEVVSRSIEYQRFPEFSPLSEIPMEFKDNVAILHVAHVCYDHIQGKTYDEFQHPFMSACMELLKFTGIPVGDFFEQYVLGSLGKKINTLPKDVRSSILPKNGSAASPM